MADPRLNIQSGPFKGKPQHWFTRAEVVALLAPKEDAIARSRRVLEAVDRYCDLPTSGRRHALRSILLDEFKAAAGVDVPGERKR
jgi:hypothetical protein